MAIVEQIGVPAIESHVRELTDHLIGGAAELGWSILTPRPPERRGAMVAIRSHDVHALVARLAADGVIVSSRDHNLRVSPHFYNSHADIERVLAGLHANSDLKG
jgi:selenocysteine lyase/cysteine desulfurase